MVAPLLLLCPTPFFGVGSWLWCRSRKVAVAGSRVRESMSLGCPAQVGSSLSSWYCALARAANLSLLRITGPECSPLSVKCMSALRFKSSTTLLGVGDASGIRTFPLDFSSQSWSVSYSGGSRWWLLWIQLLFKHRITFINSNFHLHKECISSNIRVSVLINVVIMQCAPHFRYIDKNFFINPASS